MTVPESAAAVFERGEDLLFDRILYALKGSSLEYANREYARSLLREHVAAQLAAAIAHADEEPTP
jgi:hypothetical protein